MNITNAEIKLEGLTLDEVEDIRKMNDNKEFQPIIIGPIIVGRGFIEELFIEKVRKDEYKVRFKIWGDEIGVR